MDPEGLAVFVPFFYMAGAALTIDSIVDSEPPQAKGAKVADAALTGFKQTALSQGVKKGMADIAKGKSHGNKLNSKSAEGYTLRDKNGQIQKFDETTRGEDRFGVGNQKRYSRVFLKDNDLDYFREISGTKKDMHQWQHDKIIDYKMNNGGNRPPLNKLDY